MLVAISPSVILRRKNRLHSLLSQLQVPISSSHRSEKNIRTTRVLNHTAQLLPVCLHDPSLISLKWCMCHTNSSAYYYKKLSDATNVCQIHKCNRHRHVHGASPQCTVRPNMLTKLITETISPSKSYGRKLQVDWVIVTMGKCCSIHRKIGPVLITEVLSELFPDQVAKSTTKISGPHKHEYLQLHRLNHLHSHLFTTHMHLRKTDLIVKCTLKKTTRYVHVGEAENVYG